jgi:hypothetical protein
MIATRLVRLWRTERFESYVYLCRQNFDNAGNENPLSPPLEDNVGKKITLKLTLTLVFLPA